MNTIFLCSGMTWAGWKISSTLLKMLFNVLLFFVSVECCHRLCLFHIFNEEIWVKLMSDTSSPFHFNPYRMRYIMIQWAIKRFLCWVDWVRERERSVHYTVAPTHESWILISLRYSEYVNWSHIVQTAVAVVVLYKCIIVDSIIIPRAYEFGAYFSLSFIFAYLFHVLAYSLHHERRSSIAHKQMLVERRGKKPIYAYNTRLSIGYGDLFTLKSDANNNREKKSVVR